MPNVIERLRVCATDQVSALVLVVSYELRILVLACSSFIYCFRGSKSLPWNSDTHHGNPDKLLRGIFPTYLANGLD